MSKKITYLLFISAFIFFIGASFALAQDSGGTSLPPPPQTGAIPNTANSLDAATPTQGVNLDQNNNGDQGLDQVTQNQISDLKTQVEAIKAKIDALRQAAVQKMDALKTKIQGQANKTKAKTQEAIIIGREQALNNFDTAIQRVEDLKTKV